MNGDPCLLSATVLRGLIATKQISPFELTRAVLARAEALQPELNCFITICGDEALAAAREAERKLMAGEPLGLLHGIPATVKDIVNTRGVTTSFGAIPYKDNVPNEDAVAVARLRAEGAILIGKTTTPEFGSNMPDRLAAVRPHPQCVERRALVGRLQWRRGGGGGERHRAACDRNRWRRLDADSRRLQRRGRAEAEQWRHPA
ncbi:hypothetical protein ACVWXL_002039 [Bradyrhizobium sp. GM22.5]